MRLFVDYIGAMHGLVLDSPACLLSRPGHFVPQPDWAAALIVWERRIKSVLGGDLNRDWRLDWNLAVSQLTVSCGGFPSLMLDWCLASLVSMLEFCNASKSGLGGGPGPSDA